MANQILVQTIRQVMVVAIFEGDCLRVAGVLLYKKFTRAGRMNAFQGWK